MNLINKIKGANITVRGVSSIIVWVCAFALISCDGGSSDSGPARTDFEYNNSVSEVPQEGWVRIDYPTDQVTYDLPNFTSTIDLRGRALGFRTIRMIRDCYRTDPFSPLCTGYSEWKYKTYLSPDITVTDESGKVIGYVNGDWSLDENIVDWSVIVTLHAGRNEIIVNADYPVIEDENWPYEDVFDNVYFKDKYTDQIVINVPL